MKSHLRWAATALIVVASGVSSVSNAALVDRGGGMIYDTDLNITWLADANYAMTTGYSADGLMTWSQANTWTAGLTVGGVSGWRLPTSDACSVYDCTGSEMGHLYYNELGGVAMTDITTTHNANYNLFQNVLSYYNGSGYYAYYYWSGTEDASYTSNAWLFNTFSDGAQYPVDKGNYLLAMAVHSGDVAAVSSVPVPAAVWLFGSGLLGLIGVSRRKAA